MQRRCEGDSHAYIGEDCGLGAVWSDRMNKLWQQVSIVVDWTVMITTVGLTVFLIVGTFTLML
jgi:hypothetical protein